MSLLKIAAFAILLVPVAASAALLVRWASRRRMPGRFPNHLALIDSGQIPHDYSTGPDLSYYTESAEFYYDLIVESAPHLKDKAEPVTGADHRMASIAYRRIVEASWGLIARGAEAIPYALRLLQSDDCDHRLAASSFFCGVRDPERLTHILEQVHATLKDEPERSVLDSLLCALGNLRSRDSIPVLARYILDDGTDDDTRDIAASSLGKIVRKRFDKRSDGTIGAAREWLVGHGYTAL